MRLSCEINWIWIPVWWHIHLWNQVSLFLFRSTSPHVCFWGANSLNGGYLFDNITTCQTMCLHSYFGSPARMNVYEVRIQLYSNILLEIYTFSKPCYPILIWVYQSACMFLRYDFNWSRIPVWKDMHLSTHVLLFLFRNHQPAWHVCFWGSISIECWYLCENIYTFQTICFSVHQFTCMFMRREFNMSRILVWTPIHFPNNMFIFLCRSKRSHVCFWGAISIRFGYVFENIYIWHLMCFYLCFASPASMHVYELRIPFDSDTCSKPYTFVKLCFAIRFDGPPARIYVSAVRIKLHSDTWLKTSTYV